MVIFQFAMLVITRGFSMVFQSSRNRCIGKPVASPVADLGSEKCWGWKLLRRTMRRTRILKSCSVSWEPGAGWLFRWTRIFLFHVFFLISKIQQTIETYLLKTILLLDQFWRETIHHPFLRKLLPSKCHPIPSHYTGSSIGITIIGYNYPDYP